MSNFEEFDKPLPDETPEPQSLSLLGGIAGGDMTGDSAFELGRGDESKRVTQQSILIGVIVTVVAFGALMGMRMTHKSASASTVSDETMKFMNQVDIKIANLDKMDPNDPLHPSAINRLFKDTAAIVAAIENDPTEKQVPLAQVQMNPFTPVHVEKTEVAAQDDGAAAEAERQAQLRRLYAELARIEIQSLVGGSRPRAFIGGDLLKVGDRVGSFTIRAIDNRRVVFDAVGFELRAKEPRFIRGMDQGK